MSSATDSHPDGFRSKKSPLLKAPPGFTSRPGLQAGHTVGMAGQAGLWEADTLVQVLPGDSVSGKKKALGVETEGSSGPFCLLTHLCAEVKAQTLRSLCGTLTLMLSSVSMAAWSFPFTLNVQKEPFS